MTEAAEAKTTTERSEASIVRWRREELRSEVDCEGGREGGGRVGREEEEQKGVWARSWLGVSRGVEPQPSSSRARRRPARVCRRPLTLAAGAIGFKGSELEAKTGSKGWRKPGGRRPC